MKIVKLPVCYVRYLYAGYVVWYEGYYYYFTDGYLQEIEKDGRRYIIASRHRFGSDTVEDVIVGVRV